MSNTVIFIASCPHSGSTLVDLVLGGHPSFVGLGEVYNVISPKSNVLGETPEHGCSCGASMDECAFWGRVSAELKTRRNLTISKRYEVILDCFQDVFGPDYIPVDSSKRLRALQALRQVRGCNLKVIHLVRDVRAWTISMRDAYERHHSQRMFSMRHLLKRVLRRVECVPLSCFYRWYRDNKRIAEFLEREHIANLRIGYEQLCLRTDSTINRICDFLKVRPNEGMRSLLNSTSHCLLGNRMRHQKDKRQQIMYDCRWLCRNEWLLCSRFMNRVMSFNREVVYGHSSALFGYSLGEQELSGSRADRAVAFGEWLKMREQNAPDKEQ
jgi:hypothetical protein